MQPAESPPPALDGADAAGFGEAWLEPEETPRTRAIWADSTWASEAGDSQLDQRSATAAPAP
eukprot:5788323-Alexandrium_andersonii.AAC.1